MFASTTSPLVGTVFCDLMCAQSVLVLVAGWPAVVSTTALSDDE
jgi:hypothetical protein